MFNRLKATSIVTMVLACGTLGASQADRAQTEALSKRAADRLNALHDEAARLAAEERTLLGDLRRLEIDREIKAEELRQLEQEAAIVTRELAALDAQVATLESQERSDTPKLRARLVTLYKLGQGRYIRLLLSTAGIGDLGQAARMIAAMAEQDQRRVAEHQRRLDQIRLARAALDERGQRLVSLRREAALAKTAADQAVMARNALIETIDRRRDLNAQLTGELLGAQQRLQATLAGVAADGTGSVSTLPIGPFRGDLEWPVAGSVRRAFGQSSRAGTVTNGIDIEAAEGATVGAVHEGSVAFAGPFSGFGRLVIVHHGGQTFSLYGNLGDTAVAQGERVNRGDRVGTAGIAVTGAAGLYFELRVDGRPVDPLQWLRRR
jgi:septal ring factor EnvC (AmiA/AmiB activator)